MIYACIHYWIFIYYIAVRADSLTAPVFVSVKYIQFMKKVFRASTVSKLSAFSNSKSSLHGV